MFYFTLQCLLSDERALLKALCPSNQIPPPPVPVPPQQGEWSTAFVPAMGALLTGRLYATAPFSSVKLMLLAGQLIVLMQPILHCLELSKWQNCTVKPAQLLD